MDIMQKVKSKVKSVYNYLFFTRTYFFQIAYVVIVGALHAAIVRDGLHVSMMVEPDCDPLFWPFTLLFINMIFFVICCNSNPGLLSVSGQGAELVQHSLLKHPYDGLIFHEGAVCSTCKCPKPARSKHCSVMNRCYYKFDHYCVWICNVVAGFNHRYFLALLISLFVMCFHGAYATIKVFRRIVIARGLWNAKYIDSTGTKQPMDYYNLIQVLGLHYKRLSLSLLSLVVLSVLVGCFAFYHISLALSNQTTNERYKWHYLLKARCQTQLQQQQPVSSTSNCSSKERKSNENSVDNAEANPARYGDHNDDRKVPNAQHSVVNIYDRGLWMNLWEELFPLWDYPLQNKKSKDS